jgi:tetratricopeptide (TPR) repeat protein
VFPASSLQEKEKMFSSVIKVLDSDEELRGAHANVHAHLIRALMYYDAGDQERALVDADKTLELSSGKERLLEARAHRVAADANEALGRLPQAILALRNCAASDPSFQTKISKEIERLKARL